MKIDIIKHPNETDGKSTAIHAKILAPNDVTIYTYPCIPDFEKDKVGLQIFFFTLFYWCHSFVIHSECMSPVFPGSHGIPWSTGCVCSRHDTAFA